MQPPRLEIPRRRKVLTALLVLAVTSIVCLVALEFLLRTAGPKSLNPEQRLYPPRIKLWSSPHFRLDENGAVCFLPNEALRSVFLFKHQVEYDVYYRTNNFGLIDHEDYAAGVDGLGSARRIAIAGDSFAAGTHGGEAWIPALRDRLRDRAADAELYNLGVSGASLLHVEKLLASLHGRLPFNEIAIVGISDDFGRGFWIPHSDGKSIWFSFPTMPLETALGQRPVGYVIVGDETPAELSAISKAAHGEDVGRIRGASLFQRTFVGSLATLAVHRLRGYRKSTSSMFRDNIDALARIRESYPEMPVSFIHLPQRREVRIGKYKVELEGAIRALGIRYWPALHDGEWSLNMFHPHEVHPNAAGYRRVASYVQKVLDLNAP